jgi:uncharacterized membrane protein HdeD (DUF308 family)
MDKTRSAENLEHLRRRWGRFAQFGVALIVLGIIALGTLNAAVMLFGWLVFVSGLLEAVQAFQVRRWQGFFLHLIPGIAGLPVGLLIATHPSSGVLGWALMFASFFTIVGLSRTIVAFLLKFPQWGWVVFDGAATLLLAALLWGTWPWRGTWFFGFAVGLSLILRGWSSIMFALGLRSLRSANRARLRVA